MDDDDSVLPGADRRPTHRADPRSYKPLIRARQSTGIEEENAEGEPIGLCLAESSLMSRRYVPRLGLFPLRASRLDAHQ